MPDTPPSPTPTDPAAHHTPNHMTPDEFRAEGHRMIDAIADYMRTVETMPVTPPSPPGSVLDALPSNPPESPADPANTWDDIHRDLRDTIIPNLTHWQHPGFFAYFSCNASGPGILGEIASAGLNVNGMLWSTSPAATELETRVVDWCRDALGLPEAFEGNGVIQGTASEATLIALLAARHRARAIDHEATERSVLITSTQAHSSVIKAAMIAGLADSPDHQGPNTRVRLVAANPDGSMNIDDLERTIASVHAEGRRVLMVSATAGTTGTGAIDDANAIRDTLDRAHDRDHPGSDWPTWLHLDAAWLGVAAICPEHRDVLAGARTADSVCVNPHKWLLTNFDCDLFWVRDRAALTGALSITPSTSATPRPTPGP
jgi:aromatic-L-amino-acid decarboxylase